MDVQSVEIPSSGTPAISLPSADRRGRPLSVFASFRRGFGLFNSRTYAVYPVKNPFKEEHESQTLERLEEPLEEEKEKKQLVIPPPTVIETDSEKEPPKIELAESKLESLEEKEKKPPSPKRKKLF